MTDNAKVFPVHTVWTNALGVILGFSLSVIVFSFRRLYGSDVIASIIESRIGFLVIFGGGFGLGEFLIAPRLHLYHLMAEFDGLHARVPSRHFPSFTPWHNIHAFTVTNVKPRSFRLSPGSRYRLEPTRCLTLKTSDGSYSFEFTTIENEIEFNRIMSAHLEGRRLHELS